MGRGATKYYNFMENSVGLGRNGTHLAHAGVAGGATWAAGKYGGIDVIADNWWSPFAGAFAGLGLSITARALLVNDEVQFDLLMKRIQQDKDSGIKLTKTQQERLEKLVSEFESAAIAAKSGNSDEKAANL